MIISHRVENIFAYAVALQQSGRLKSTIYAYDRTIFIFNQDQTVLLKFLLGSQDKSFEKSVSFYANDYDSKNIEIDGGKICFVKKESDFERKKSCQVPKMEFAEIEDIFKSFSLTKKNKIVINRDILSLLEESLSHIEFSSKKKKLRIIQRNIYTGSIIKITKSGRGLGAFNLDDYEDFFPVGLRTNDFTALFTFADEFNFYFPSEAEYIWGESKGLKMKFQFVVSKCKYDELGGEDHGRKKQKIRRN